MPVAAPHIMHARSHKNPVTSSSWLTSPPSWHSQFLLGSVTLSLLPCSAFILFFIFSLCEFYILHIKRAHSVISLICREFFCGANLFIYTRHAGCVVKMNLVSCSCVWMASRSANFVLFSSFISGGWVERVLCFIAEPDEFRSFNVITITHVKIFWITMNQCRYPFRKWPCQFIGISYN